MFVDKMTSLTSRQHWRRARAATIRKERTIIAYIQSKHSKIYQEAVGFYTKLNNKYPSKHDLRKLPEFYELAHHVDTNITEGFQDTMELRIPLLACNTPDTSALQEDPSTPDTPALQEDPSTPDTPALQKDPSTPDTLALQEDPSTPDTPALQGDMDVQELGECVQLGELDQDIIDKIVADLQNDPNIYSIFEDIQVDELTPLESELLSY